MEALRIELPREAFDVLGGKGEGSQLAPQSDLDIFIEAHQPCAPSRRRMIIGEIISHSTTSRALRTTPLKVTMPVSGRLSQTRASLTSTSSVQTSPARNRAR